MLDWLNTFCRKHDLEKVDTSLFYDAFYTFFMSKVMTNRDGINISVEMVNVDCDKRFKNKFLEKDIFLVRKIVSKIDSSTDKEATLNQELDKINHGMSSIKDFQHPYRVHREPVQMAQIANDFLVSKLNPKVETLHQSRYVSSFLPFELNASKVEEVIASLKSVPASGMLMMTSEMLHLTNKASARILYLIFKRSINEGKVPDDWRHTLVKLKHKDGAKDNIANYRPIGITCVPSKVTHYSFQIIYFLP
jgi:hypothetical protein